MCFFFLKKKIKNKKNITIKFVELHCTIILFADDGGRSEEGQGVGRSTQSQRRRRRTRLAKCKNLLLGIEWHWAWAWWTALASSRWKCFMPFHALWIGMEWHWAWNWWCSGKLEMKIFIPFHACGFYHLLKSTFIRDGA